MDKLAQIDQACKKNNHDLINQLINSIDSDDQKRDAFLKIFNSYEEEGLFPIGYSLLFIKWLIRKHDLISAMDQIMRCVKKGVPEKRLSQFIYEDFIKPDEASYRERFNRHLQLLERHEILFAEQEFDFDVVKREILIIANYQKSFFLPDSLYQQNHKRILMADVTDTEIMRRVLENNNVVYLVYDDLKKFYYLLLFEDLSGLSKYMEGKSILIFNGAETNLFYDFFSNTLIPPPDFYFGVSTINKYHNIIDNLISLVNKTTLSQLKLLREYYRNLNPEYYRKLFSQKDVSNIKVMLITTERTDLNKFIVKNWYNAFSILGYNVKLLIEREPYEHISPGHVIEQISEFKPDIVFHVNYNVNDIFEDELEIRKSLLWIMRYRDKRFITFNADNIFISAMNKDLEEDSKKYGIPRDRIFCSPEGIDLTIFTKNEKINEQYTCDVVSVNNSGGGELFLLNHWSEKLGKNKSWEILNRMLAELKNMALNDIFMFYPDEFGKLIDNILYSKGKVTDKEGKKILSQCCAHISRCLYRGKIIEWIIDSGITRNIKLWGRWWSENKKFRHYHMGIARYGQQLAEIYRSGKVAISDEGTLHERTFEILASGGFPLVRYLKLGSRNDTETITHYFKEDEEIVLFYSKDDLLNKLQYYLDHPGERERIAENGRQVVLRNFSHTAIAGKTMEFIKKYYAAAGG